MSDVIDFLENAGRRASARFAPVHAWDGFDALDHVHREALRSLSFDAVARVLEARAVMLCMVSLPDGGETEAPDDAPDTDAPDDSSDSEDEDTPPA